MQHTHGLRSSAKSVFGYLTGSSHINALFGHAQLYTRKLDDDVLITVNFSLDQGRLTDVAWYLARQRDIETILRSVHIESLK